MNFSLLGRLLVGASFVATLAVGVSTTTFAAAGCSAPADVFLNPFNKNSAHHRPIGTGAQYASNSHPATRDWLKARRFNVNAGGPWGADVVAVGASDPLFTISAAGSRVGLPATVRLPKGGLVTKVGYNQYGSTDGVSVIHDRTNNSVTEFFQYKWNNGRPTASIRRQWDIRGLGHGTRSGERLGTSASGVAMMFGLLRGHEINTPGYRIGHALQIALPRLPGQPMMLSRQVVPPATNTDGSAKQGGNNTGNIPYGALLALPPSVNISKLGLSEPGRRLAEAIRDYGMYVVDGGGPTIRADQNVSKQVLSQIWNDIGKFYPHIRMVLNNNLGSPVAGGGKALAPNCAIG
jgi:hypothetical protein